MTTSRRIGEEGYSVRNEKEDLETRGNDRGSRFPSCLVGNGELMTVRASFVRGLCDECAEPMVDVHYFRDCFELDEIRSHGFEER